MRRPKPPLSKGYETAGRRGVVCYDWAETRRGFVTVRFELGSPDTRFLLDALRETFTHPTLTDDQLEALVKPDR